MRSRSETESAQRVGLLASVRATPKHPEGHADGEHDAERQAVGEAEVDAVGGGGDQRDDQCHLGGHHELEDGEHGGALVGADTAIDVAGRDGPDRSVDASQDRNRHDDADVVEDQQRDKQEHAADHQDRDGATFTDAGDEGRGKQRAGRHGSEARNDQRAPHGTVEQSAGRAQAVAAEEGLDEEVGHLVGDGDETG